MTPIGSERDAQAGHVYLVGAGPGDPDLLTMRAHRLLRSATRILPDDLVSPEVLALAGSGAEVIPVGKRCGQLRVTQAEINQLLVSSAQAGHAVLRLKSGDPLVFGRIAEELKALRAAAIPVEIVPGVSAAFAAAAALEVPLTDRSAASKLIFATAHSAANTLEQGRSPQPVWTGPLPGDATLVIYMPGRDLERLAGELISAGVDAKMPVTAISRVSTPEQTSHQTTLARLRTEHCGPAPLLLLIGRAIRREND